MTPLHSKNFFLIRKAGGKPTGRPHEASKLQSLWSARDKALPHLRGVVASLSCASSPLGGAAAGALMARIRSTHPEQWTDDQFVTCSPHARLLALGIRNEADDNGIFEWNPIKLKMRLLPADNVDIEALLQELLATNQVIQFEAEGRKFGLIRSFQRYQRPKKPSFIHPIPTEPLPNGYRVSDKYSPTGSEPVPHQSGNSRSDVVGEGEVKGEEGGVNGKHAIKTLIPDDFGLNERLIRYAARQGVRNRKVLERFTETFITQCQAKGYKYADHEAAWKNWLRSDIDADKIPKDPVTVTVDY